MLNLADLSGVDYTPLEPNRWFEDIVRLAAIDRGYHQVAFDWYNVPSGKPFDLFAHLANKVEDLEVISRASAGDTHYVLGEAAGLLIAINYRPEDGLGVTVTSNDWDAAHAITVKLGEGIPKQDKVPVTSVAMNLWLWNEGIKQPSNIANRYEVPRWKEIAANYPTDTAVQAEAVMGYNKDSFGSGRVILLHGPPGTGKTHVIRALAREWKKWASCQYITDAEHFFGNPYYMMTVVLQMAQHNTQHIVLIIEDCGEFITQDSSKRAHQSLARLLNLADGILGQNLNLSIVMTTNEPVTDLHPALARNGRCAAMIEFPSFPEKEANAWFESHGCETRVDDEVTLADMYALLRETTE